MMYSKKALVVGGSNGVGLAMVNKLLKNNCEKIIIVDKVVPCIENEKVEFLNVDLTDCDFDIFKDYQDIDTLIITAGFGRTAPFETIQGKEIENSFKVNSIAVINIIREYYSKLLEEKDLYCAVMGSIAGMISSPLFSLYSSTKAAVCRFIESLNVELKMNGSQNRILNVSPGSLKGTRFNNGENNLELLNDVSDKILKYMYLKRTIYIPNYNDIFKGVIERYNNNSEQYGIESYEYKIKSGRMNLKPQLKIGYLSGTFDLFHIGHLNLLKNAKKHCDYLVVGVHKDGSHKNKPVFVPYEERVEILKSIKYVDKVVQSTPEDKDMYEKIKYDYLFVGSDYKGTERFLKYEKFFEGTKTKIIYFPYTATTSSTKLRSVIDKEIENI